MNHDLKVQVEEDAEIQATYYLKLVALGVDALHALQMANAYLWYHHRPRDDSDQDAKWNK